MKNLIIPFVLLLTLIFSCQKNDLDEELPKKTASYDVYVAGKENNIACYWKNNVKINLTNGAGITPKKIIIDNNNVYVFGYKYNSYYNIEYYFWINNVKYELKNYLGIPSSSITFFHDFTVKNNDILFSGYVNDTGILTNYDLCYWKNGVKTVLINNQNNIYNINIDFYDNNIYLSTNSKSYYINNILHNINAQWKCNFAKNNNAVYHIYIDNNNTNLNYYNTTTNTLEFTLSINDEPNFSNATIISDPIKNNLYTFSFYFKGFYIKNNQIVNFSNNLNYKIIQDMKVNNDNTYMIRASFTTLTPSTQEYKVFINDVETQYINSTNGSFNSIFVVAN